MLSYHPALDSNHAVFRILSLLEFLADKELEIERVRILDFYCVFPYLLSQISVPMNLVSKKNQFKDAANPYNFGGDPRYLFAQIKVFQETALSVLASNQYIDADLYSKGVIKKGAKKASGDLVPLITSFAAERLKLFSFLIADLGDIPLLGDEGLKKRTGLMEYRYDDA